MAKLKLEELNRIDINTFKKSEKIPICIVLDNIRSMHNVGSVFRTSDAFRVKCLHLCGVTAQPPHRDIEKTSLGATESVNWEYHEETLALIKSLKEAGWKIIAIEQTDNSILLNNFKPLPEEKYAFVFGNEVFGVFDEVIKEADQIVEIPQFGTKHSFNISVTTGIILWDYFSKVLPRF